MNKEDQVSINIFDLNGNLIKPIIKDQTFSLGLINNAVNDNLWWDGKNQDNNVVPFGIYIMKITAGENKINKPVVVIK